MPSNKKHHYVPQFYLRRFSTDGKSINIWNIPNCLKITSVNLKNQCYKNYFYGKDLSVEKALGLIESRASQILRLIDEYEAPPPYGSAIYLDLVIYVLMQYGRTTYTADSLNEMGDKLIKHVLQHEKLPENINLNDFTIGIKDSAQFSLSLVSQFYPLVLDMACKLLVNQTSTDFVASDNPVVLYNQLLSFRNFGSNTGMAAKGLQIFFPISSNKLLMFYDHASYSAGSRSKAYIKVTSLRDIYELNTLQMASAYGNVYYKDTSFAIEPLVRKASPYRRDRKSDMKVFPGEENRDTRSEFIATSRVDVRTNLRLSFISVTRSTKKWVAQLKRQKLQPSVIPRNAELLDAHQEFMKKVDAGEWEPGSFFVSQTTR